MTTPIGGEHPVDPLDEMRSLGSEPVVNPTVHVYSWIVWSPAEFCSKEQVANPDGHEPSLKLLLVEIREVLGVGERPHVDGVLDLARLQQFDELISRPVAVPQCVNARAHSPYDSRTYGSKMSSNREIVCMSSLGAR